MFKNCRNNQAQWGEHKEFRNFVLLQIRQAKKCYYKALIDNSKPRDKWAVLNKIADKRKKSQDIAILNYENTTVTSQSEIANKNGGITQIPTFIYKMLTPYIIYSLTALINKIIDTSTFLCIWKEALVTPLPKPGDPSNPSNYRPISSLPILSKVAEKVIAHQIREHLEDNTRISPNQYGFRRNHSTQSLLLQLTNKSMHILDNTTGDKYVCLIALDIKKSF